MATVPRLVPILIIEHRYWLRTRLFERLGAITIGANDARIKSLVVRESWWITEPRILSVTSVVIFIAEVQAVALLLLVPLLRRRHPKPGRLRARNMELKAGPRLRVSDGAEYPRGLLSSSELFEGAMHKDDQVERRCR